MFDINNIQYNQTTKQYTCCYQCDSPQDAEYLCAKYTMLPKKFDIVGEINCKGSTVIIGTSNPKAAVAIASSINANYFMPSLDVFIFYGSSQIELESQWCVGFNFPNATQYIDFINTQERFITADRNPQNWQDKQGNTYSVVMLTGVMESELSEECKEKVNLLLDVIANTTSRKLNPLQIQ